MNPGKVYGCSELQKKLYSKVFDFDEILKMRGKIFENRFKLYKEKMLTDSATIKS